MHLFRIHFYKDNSGNEPIKEYIRSLQTSANNKDSRVKLKKIVEYIDVLANNGTRAGEPYVKHIDGDIWELRPLKNRVFFFCWNGNSFVLLHHFVKQTQKTPKKEIEQAKRNMRDFIERSGNNEYR